jgi:hypothetical protein
LPTGSMCGRCSLLLAELQHLLARAVAAHLGGRRIDAQVLAGQLEAWLPSSKATSSTRFLVQLDVGGSNAGSPWWRFRCGEIA